MRLVAAFLAACPLATGLVEMGHAAEPVTVTVRYIDARNGKPYTLFKGPWQLSLYKSDPRKTSGTRAEMQAIELGSVRARSDANGKAKFTLPNPMPRSNPGRSCPHRLRRARLRRQGGGRERCRGKERVQNQVRKDEREVRSQTGPDSLLRSAA